MLKATNACPRSKITPLRERPHHYNTPLRYTFHMHMPVSIYLGKRNNVDKPAEDLPWWP